MSTILNKKALDRAFHIERFDSAIEVVEKSRTRKITSSAFEDKTKQPLGKFEGVKSFDEALKLMAGGYQPTVDSMRGIFKMSRTGERKRFTFQNNVQGFAPIVPLALKNVPNSMLDMSMRPIKSKVIDVYCDMTVACRIESSDIIKAGQSILGVIIEMEQQGYRFNLYTCQTYSDEKGCDMMVVKVKDATQPIDLKRISFPLTHTAFFRVIGFDWYSRVPGGKYRSGYGRAIAYGSTEEQLRKTAEQLFGRNAVYLTTAKVVDNGRDYVKEALENDSKKR